MAEFNFHGKTELVEELYEELPSDGSPWDEFILEAVKAHKGQTPVPEAESIRRFLDREMIEILPEDEVERFRYLKESIELRKKMEARELVLAPPDAVDYGND